MSPISQYRCFIKNSRKETIALYSHYEADPCVRGWTGVVQQAGAFVLSKAKEEREKWTPRSSGLQASTDRQSRNHIAGHWPVTEGDTLRS